MPVHGSPGFSAGGLLPPQVLAAAAGAGAGTVRSEIDRAIRVVLAGDGPASTRAIVADSAAAAALLASPRGLALEQAIRGIVSVADAHAGHDNLHSLSLLPDEQAAGAVMVLNSASVAARAGEPAMQAASPEAARALVDELTAPTATDLAFAGAWNGGGEIVLAPDTSRSLLASIGLYHDRFAAFRDNPGIPEFYAASRAAAARGAWETVVHEVHHSITPRPPGHAPEDVRVVEEASATLLARLQAEAVMQLGGAGAPFVDPAPVSWSAWSPSRLPPAPTAQQLAAAARYVDGPKLLGDLLALAGLDERTPAGRRSIEDLLQRDVSARVPQALAEAIVTERQLDAGAAPRLAELIRKATTNPAVTAEILHYVDLRAHL